MAGLLDLHRNPGADVLTAPLPTVPRGDVERFELEWAAARAPDRSYFYRRRLHELYDQVSPLAQGQHAQAQARPGRRSGVCALGPRDCRPPCSRAPRQGTARRRREGPKRPRP